MTCDFYSGDEPAGKAGPMVGGSNPKVCSDLMNNNVSCDLALSSIGAFAALPHNLSVDEKNSRGGGREMVFNFHVCSAY